MISCIPLEISRRSFAPSKSISSLISAHTPGDTHSHLACISVCSDRSPGTPLGLSSHNHTTFLLPPSLLSHPAKLSAPPRAVSCTASAPSCIFAVLPIPRCFPRFHSPCTRHPFSGSLLTLLQIVSVAERHLCLCRSWDWVPSQSYLRRRILWSESTPEKVTFCR